VTQMAILQDVDKCMRCNGCVISCKRTWGLAAETIGVHKVSYDQRVAIKSQAAGDMGPFMRFSCWHCPQPPCVGACPFGVLKKEATGAVSVDAAKCAANNTKCVITLTDGTKKYPCAAGCQRGGYPKIDGEHVPEGVDSGKPVTMNKCTLCHGKAGADDPLKAMLPSRASTDGGGYYSMLTGTKVYVPELAHEPSCVYTCPAKAMTWDSRDNIITFLKANYTLPSGAYNWVGNGSMFWASKKMLLAPPKADPFVEDHVVPLAAGLGKLGVVPTLVLGGLLAVSARRARNEEEAAASTGEV